MKDYLKLYLVLETKMLKKPLEEFIPEVVKGGVTCIQIRDKGCCAKEQFDTAVKVMKLLEGEDVMLVINDRADVALAAGASVVHVGEKDVPLAFAQEAFPDMLFGYSCNNMRDINTAKSADYIGVGPAFPTNTKADLRGLIGPEGIGELLKHTDRPAVAIGGITATNIEQLKGLGLAGVAVSSAICASDDPFEAAKELRALSDKL